MRAAPGFRDLVPADPEVTRYVEGWRADSYHDRGTVVLAPAPWELTDEMVRRRSTDFGNLVADVFRGALAADPTEACHREGSCVPKSERGSVDGWKLPAEAGR
jgi:hypothetical protein